MKFKEHIRFSSDIEINHCPKLMIRHYYINNIKRFWQNLYKIINNVFKWLKLNIKGLIHGKVS